MYPEQEAAIIDAYQTASPTEIEDEEIEDLEPDWEKEEEIREEIKAEIEELERDLDY